MAESGIETTSKGDSLISRGVMKCLRCKGVLEQSGGEAYRFVCRGCGQNFIATMQLVPVAPKKERKLLDAGECSGTS